MNKENTIRVGDFSTNDSSVREMSDNKLWKKVSLGTVSGILLGAGGIRTYEHYETQLNKTDAADQSDTESDLSAPVYEQAPMAHVSNNIPFGEAFAAARAEVGAGGVFSWHGGIYGTYSAEEWDSMTDAQRTAFADSVHPTVPPQYVRVSQISEAHPDVVITTEATVDQTTEGGIIANSAELNNDNEVINDNTSDDDVRILGQGEIQGHSAAALDLTGNNEADVVVIDVDDSQSLTEPDVVIFREGAVTTMGDIVEGNPPEWIDDGSSQVNMENPDVAPDMPDYMDDAVVSL